MPGVDSQNHRLYIGSHDGVCALGSSDGGKTWEASKRTPLSHAASRLTATPQQAQKQECIPEARPLAKVQWVERALVVPSSCLAS